MNAFENTMKADWPIYLKKCSFNSKLTQDFMKLMATSLRASDLGPLGFSLLICKTKIIYCPSLELLGGSDEKLKEIQKYSVITNNAPSNCLVFWAIKI